MVTNPMDKRCVVTFEDSSPQFRLVAFLRDLIMNGKMSPLEFSHLQWRKIKTPKNQFGRTGRNQPCMCGSGKKYKKCCINKDAAETDHVDIIGSRIGIGELSLDVGFDPRKAEGDRVQGAQDQAWEKRCQELIQVP